MRVSKLLNLISHTPRGGVAHALLRAVSRLISTPSPASNIASSPGVGNSDDAARRSACATSRGVIMALLVIAATTLPGQALIPGAQAEMGANLPALPIGPYDLLAISVYAAP